MSAPANQDSERARLHPLMAQGGVVPLRDLRDLMAHPFFSLSKSRRMAPIQYKAGDVELQVNAASEHGLATIWDADVLIWAVSQIRAAEDGGLSASRCLQFTPYQLLKGIGRTTGARSYFLIKAALRRLQTTHIRTSIGQGAQWRHQPFSWICEWEERTARGGRVEGMTFVLPDWFYQRILDGRLVLAIAPDYFALTGGFERWLYRVARKHAGRQVEGWRFELRHLHAKSGSLARYGDFARDLRAIIRRQPLPGYRLAIERTSRGSELVHIRPGDTLCTTPGDIRTSGGLSVRTSGAGPSVHRTHGLRPSPWLGEPNPSGKESREDSKSYHLQPRSVENAAPCDRSRRGRER